MKNIDTLLTLETLAELRQKGSATNTDLSLPQAQQLTAHAQAHAQAPAPFKLAIIHTYTSDLLEPWIQLESALQNLQVSTYHAPYGLTVQEAHAASGTAKHQPDLTLLLLRREDLHPALTQPLGAKTRAELNELQGATVNALCALVKKFRTSLPGQIVVTVLPSMLGPGSGLYDAHFERSEATWWAQTKAEIAQCLRESTRATLFLDLDCALAEIGRRTYFDKRYWYSAQFPFSAPAARDLARRVVSLGAVIKYPKKKVIVLDADNTLWGGIIGEDGMTGIALSPEYPGSAYVDFQRRLLQYQSRGFILALCSKNNAADVDQVLQEHPHQVLRDKHFAARRVNWEPKPDNLESLAKELNLGLDSFVFVDDSDYECAAVRHRLPQVEVIQTPARPVEVPTCLESVARLEILSLTDEDLQKTQMYAEERQRRELKANFETESEGDLNDYLVSLDMHMQVALNDANQLKRLAQLTQKTNQFNLTTRRYDEQQMLEFLQADTWLVGHFSLTDTFGSSGVVGLALFRLNAPKQAELDTFLMSCRVIGRYAETVFLHTLLAELAQAGIEKVVADYLPTTKNSLVAEFLPQHQFTQRDDGRYERTLSTETDTTPNSEVIAVEILRD